MSTIGTVANWRKVYGFINYVENGQIKTIFTHYSNLTNARKLKQNQIVSFDIGENERGLVAENVEVLDAKIKSNARTKRE